MDKDGKGGIWKFIGIYFVKILMRSMDSVQWGKIPSMNRINDSLLRKGKKESFKKIA